MSVYIVEDSTLHRVLTYLNTDRDADWSFRRHLGPLGYSRDQADDLHRLCGDLHLLNCDAVDNRYGHGTAAQDTADTATLPRFRVALCSRLQAYKALKCLLYQCSEGDVPTRPLYQAMRAIGHDLADTIVAGLPDYDKAQWG